MGTRDAIQAAGGPRGLRRRFRLRVHIATLFVALITTAGLALVGYGYVATSRLLVTAGEEELFHVAERTAGEVRNLLAPARVLVQLLARDRLTRAAGLATRLDSLSLLTTALDRHVEISAVYVGFDTGEFFLVRTLHDARQRLDTPPEAVYLVQSRPAGDTTPGRFLFLDTRLAVVSQALRPDYRFDPRTREWYRLALRTPEPVRTPPYVFFTTREVGTTMAQRSADGRSVVGVDITLQALTRHLARARVPPASRLALVDRDGRVVAHRGVGRPGPAQPEAPPELLRLEDLGDPALSPLLGSASRTRQVIPLWLDQVAWIGVSHAIETGVGDPLILLVAAPRDELVVGARRLAQRQLLIGLAVVGLALGLVGLSARRISRPLEALTRSVERIGQGDLDTALPGIGNPLEVARLADVTDRMRAQIRDHIEERVARMADEQRRARELDIARQIQQSMLPTPPVEPLEGCYAVAATLRPAREVGGDLYDFFPLDGHRLTLAIADVADKGVPAALLMARVTGLFRVLGRGSGGPDEVLRELDARLSEGNDTCTFVTMVCVELDGESGAFRCARAGHEPPLVRRVEGAVTGLGGEGGPALGLGCDGGFPPATGYLAPGDALVLWTDGVTEASDVTGTAFGLERLRSLVADLGDEGLRGLPARVADAVERFAVGGGPRDDLALLAVEFQRPDVVVGRGDPASWRLSLSAEAGDILRVQQRVAAILRARDVDPETIHACVLTIEEVATNVVRYAGGSRPGVQAHVELRLPTGRIEIRFEDTGPPFNPLEAPAPDLDGPLEARPVGGLGLFLVRRLAGRCEYARQGSVNVFTVYHPRPAGPPEGAPPPEAGPPAGRPAMALEVTITDSGPAERRARLRGRLDTVTAPQLDAALSLSLGAAEVARLVLDLDRLEYISSAGIRCLIQARKALEGRGGHVLVVNAQPAVRKVFEIVKALPRDQVFGSAAELDRYLEAMQRRVRGQP